MNDEPDNGVSYTALCRLVLQETEVNNFHVILKSLLGFKIFLVHFGL